MHSYIKFSNDILYRILRIKTDGEKKVIFHITNNENDDPKEKMYKI